jgi:hypothetical protein
MVMISFKSKKDKEHMLYKAKQMKEYVDDYVECLENSMSDDDYYGERMYRAPHMRDRYDRYDEDPRFRMR